MLGYVLTPSRIYFNGRLYLTPIHDSDGMTVTLWRNSPSARQAFFNREIVTPDSHVAWLKHKAPHDLVWMARESASGHNVGMAGLTVDPVLRTAEAGRFFVDPAYRKSGFGLEIDWMVLAIAFDVLQLDGTWLSVYEDNAASLALHAKAGYTGYERIRAGDGARWVVHMAMAHDQWRSIHRTRFIEARNVTLPEPLE